MPTKEDLTTELINEILTILKSTKSFVVNQMPDVVQQILHWSIAESALLILIGLGMFVGAVWGLIKIRQKWKDRANHYDDDEFLFIISAIGCVCGGFVSVPIFFINLFSLVKILVAPKIYLLEYFTGLLRSGSH